MIKLSLWIVIIFIVILIGIVNVIILFKYGQNIFNLYVNPNFKLVIDFFQFYFQIFLHYFSFSYLSSIVISILIASNSKRAFKLGFIRSIFTSMGTSFFLIIIFILFFSKLELYKNYNLEKYFKGNIFLKSKVLIVDNNLLLSSFFSKKDKTFYSSILLSKNNLEKFILYSPKSIIDSKKYLTMDKFFFFNKIFNKKDVKKFVSDFKNIEKYKKFKINFLYSFNRIIDRQKQLNYLWLNKFKIFFKNNKNLNNFYYYTNFSKKIIKNLSQKNLNSIEFWISFKKFILFFAELFIIFLIFHFIGILLYNRRVSLWNFLNSIVFSVITVIFLGYLISISENNSIEKLIEPFINKNFFRLIFLFFITLIFGILAYIKFWFFRKKSVL